MLFCGFPRQTFSTYSKESNKSVMLASEYKTQHEPIKQRIDYLDLQLAVLNVDRGLLFERSLGDMNPHLNIITQKRRLQSSQDVRKINHAKKQRLPLDRLS